MPRVLLATLVSLLAASSAFAANPVVTLQNDSLASGSSAVAAAASITTGEGYAATFKVDAALTPVRLRKLQAMFVDDPSFPGTECGAFSLRVFEDSGIHSPDPDGAAVYDSMNDGEITFDIPAVAGSLQEIDLSGGGFSPIWIESTGLRVELHAESNMCLMAGTGNMHFPVLAVDSDDVSSFGLNFLFGFEKIDGVWTPTWYDTKELGLSGDFVLRAVVETTGCQPNCAGKTCGSDGCQGTCGTCQDDDVCVGGTCCSPSCFGKQCGGDGCGGSCGACGDGFVCTANGACDAIEPDVQEPDTQEPDTQEPDTQEPDVQEPDTHEPDSSEPDTHEPDLQEPDTAIPDVPGDVSAALRVLEVVPGEGQNDRETDVLVMGAGFATGATVRLDADHLIVKNVKATSIEATVPIGLSPGQKTLVVELPSGEIATLAHAFAVIDGTSVVSSGGGSGCASGARAVPSIQALAVLAVLVVAWRRRVSREG